MKSKTMCNHPSPARKIAIGLMLAAKVAVNSQGCWIWQGELTRQGYGRISFWHDSKLRRFTVHRLSYGYYYGAAPVGLVIRHKCDERRCWNFRHLVEGTQKQNIGDMIERGRAPWQKQKPVTSYVIRKYIKPPLPPNSLPQAVLENAARRARKTV